MKRIYDVDGVVETGWDEQGGSIYVKWVTFSGHDHVRPSVKAQIDAVAAGAQVIVVDVSETTGVPTDADQRWFGDVVFPAYRDHGLKALINIQPKAALTRLGAKRWSRTASGFGFDIVDCSSADHAMDIAKDYISQAA